MQSLVFGKLISANADPIEKKPLFHLLPGTQSFSVATVGCNFKCKFCQNADIAQMPGDNHGRITGQEATPSQVVQAAQQENCASIAYTYTEPTVFFEFAYETAKLATAKGIKNVFVTNGYMTPEALDMVSPYLDAANVDLKAFTDDFYKEYCGAGIEPVKQTLKAMVAKGVLVEVTTLLIPGLNDDTEELRQLADFLVTELGPETPWHISRFHPTYKLTDRGPTPVETIGKARDIGIQAGLRYVYAGNVPGDKGESTYCYHCGAMLIERWGFRVKKVRLADGKCPDCQASIHVITE